MGLNNLEQVNLNAKRLSDNMTDIEWQEYLSLMKKSIMPVKDKYMKGVSSVKLSAGEQYCGDTSAMRYKLFINDILKTIRSGQTDYAYYIYQIADLLKYEHNLKAKYLPQYRCFKITL